MGLLPNHLEVTIKTKNKEILGDMAKGITDTGRCKGGCHMILRKKRYGSGCEQSRTKDVLSAGLSTLHTRVSPKS